jgi:hypothetical protein
VSPAELIQLCLSAATLVSALTGLVVALRALEMGAKTHGLVNGQAEGIQALREAKGHAEGRVEGIRDVLAVSPASQDQPSRHGD